MRCSTICLAAGRRSGRRVAIELLVSTLPPTPARGFRLGLLQAELGQRSSTSSTTRRVRKTRICRLGVDLDIDVLFPRHSPLWLRCPPRGATTIPRNLLLSIELPKGTRAEVSTSDTASVRCVCLDFRRPREEWRRGLTPTSKSAVRSCNGVYTGAASRLLGRGVAAAARPGIHSHTQHRRPRTPMPRLVRRDHRPEIVFVLRFRRFRRSPRGPLRTTSTRPSPRKGSGAA